DADLGGTTAHLDLRKASSIAVDAPFASRADSVGYTLVVRQDGKVVREIEGEVKILSGRLAKGDEVRPDRPELIFRDVSAQGIVPNDDAFNPGRGDFSIVIFF